MPNYKLLFPDANHFISLEAAREMKSTFGREKENILIPELRNKDILSVCETFNRDAFDVLLSQDGCVGVRIYFGMTEEKKVRLMAVAVDENSSDILPLEGKEVTSKAVDGGKIIENGLPCPPWCPHAPSL